MKRIINIILVVLLASALFGCTQNQKTADISEQENSIDKIKIVTTLCICKECVTHFYIEQKVVK